MQRLPRMGPLHPPLKQRRPPPLAAVDEVAVAVAVGIVVVEALLAP